MSKTIEERAKEYADKYCNGESVIISRLMKDAIEGSYIKGATDQRAIDEKELLHPQWISVDERLPEDDAKVLVYCANENHYYIAYLSTTYWFEISNDGFVPRVTHWMPLPPPPSGNKM